MPSAFAGLWSEAVGILDGTFGEPFLVTPMLAVRNGRPTADTTRQPAQIIGEFLDDAQSQFGKSPGHADTMGQEAVTSDSRIVVTLAGLPYDLVDVDRLTRAATGERFQVSKVVPDGFGRATIHLTSRASS